MATIDSSISAATDSSISAATDPNISTATAVGPARAVTDSGAPNSIALGIGACLVGQPVRFNGLPKKSNAVLTELAQHFSLRAFCPEVAIGLGAPRAAIRLVGELGRERAVDSATATHDVSAALRAYGADVLQQNPDLCGYILVKNSPSCGLERVKRYPHGTAQPHSDAVGIFAAALVAGDPLLPLEEDGRLHDAALRESFVLRVLTYFEWKQLQRGLSYAALQDFYARRKYLLMSRHVATYKKLGRLLADGRGQPPAALAQEAITLIMTALRRPATRAGHVNTLMHIRGYLKHALSAAEKAELSELIEQYRRSEVPLVAPLTLLRHHFARHPDAYIQRQLFMEPYPAALRLRNGI